jgi:RNA-directed DNA polymerase
VNFIRYADDFIVTSKSKELLERDIKPLIEQFLQERGLELSPTKTVITNVKDGFDFLGQNVRRYPDGKRRIKPSKKNVKTFWTTSEERSEQPWVHLPPTWSKTSTPRYAVGLIIIGTP